MAGAKQRQEGQEPNCRNCGHRFIENPGEAVRCSEKGSTRFMGRICDPDIYTPQAGHRVIGYTAAGQSS